MAGDWLKVEVITPDKPEVSNIAARLGITPEEAFGRLFRVWVWCQNVSANGHVRVRDLSPIDAQAGVPGFGQAMAEEHWIEPRDGGFIIPKWERHLSKGAKKRVLDAERKRRERDDSVPKVSRTKADNVRTREEKRRVSSSPSEKKRRSPPRTTLCRMPDTFGIDAEIKVWNLKKGYPEEHLLLHLESFKLSVDKGDLMYAGDKGWHAAFKKAVNEDWAKLRSVRAVSAAQQASWLDELTGKGKGHVVEGTAERSD
jgi:hypothetical protein